MLVTRGGTLSCKVPAVFSADSGSLFVVSGAVVKVFATVTGKLTSVLRPGPSSDAGSHAVTGMLLHCRNRRQLVCCTAAGTVAVYDTDELALLQTFQVPHPIMSLVQSATTVYVALRQARSSCVLARLDVAEATCTPTSFVGKGCVGAACSPRDDYACLWNEREVVMFNLARSTAVSMKHSKEITVVAFHPRDPLLAVGDKLGKIWIWSCEPRKDVRLDLHHWHAHGVHSLCYAGGPDGQVLVSGGQEDAVVFWQLQSRKKLFTPHLGSLGVFTVSASPDGRFYSAVCGDNSLFLITAHDLNVSRRILGLKTAGPNAVKSFVTLTSAPPDHRCVVLNGHGNTLQWFNVDQDACALELEVLHAGVAPRGRPAREGDVTPVSRVELVAFGRTVMVTEDTRASSIPKRVTPERALKFWRTKDDGMGFELACTVLRPHHKRILALASCPQSHDVVCTVSADGAWKTWQLVNDDGEVGVLCLASAHFKGLMPQTCCFSLDGSLLAVMYSQSVLTLWNPLDGSLLHMAAVAHPSSQPFSLHAVPGTNLLVGCGSESTVWAYDVIQCRVVWRLSANVIAAATHWASGHVALLCAAGGLVVLHGSSPRPLWTRRMPSDAISVSFARLGRNASHVVVLCKSGLLQLVALPEADGATDALQSAATAAAAAAADGGAGRFEGILRSSFDSSVGAPADTSADDEQVMPTTFLPETPSHVLPSAATMLQVLVRQLLRPAAAPDGATERIEDVRSHHDPMEEEEEEEEEASEDHVGSSVDDHDHHRHHPRDLDEEPVVTFPHRFSSDDRRALVALFQTNPG